MADQINEIKQELRQGNTSARDDAFSNQQFVNEMREQMLCLVEFATKMSAKNNIDFNPLEKRQSMPLQERRD